MPLTAQIVNSATHIASEFSTTRLETFVAVNNQKTVMTNGINSQTNVKNIALILDMFKGNALVYR